MGTSEERLEEWRRDYNTQRPHSALGNLTPVAYAARNASVPQQPGALRSITGFAPQVHESTIEYPTAERQPRSTAAGEIPEGH